MTHTAPWTRDDVAASLPADTARAWFDEAPANAAAAARTPPTAPSP